MMKCGEKSSFIFCQNSIKSKKKYLLKFLGQFLILNCVNKIKWKSRLIDQLIINADCKHGWIDAVSKKYDILFTSLASNCYRLISWKMAVLFMNFWAHILCIVLTFLGLTTFHQPHFHFDHWTCILN